MKKKRLLLNKKIKFIVLCLITLFSVEVNAANFAYSNFNWDKFYEENKSYWTDFCSSADDMSEDECLEIVLDSKKDFYVKLYKLLAKYERKGYKLNDNYILATTFFYLTPDTFTDVPEQYREEYLEGNSYNIDMEENVDSYDVDTDEAAEYFENEKDSLKTLMKNMFSYNATCTGKVGDPSVDEKGNKYCSNGSLSGNICVGTIKTYKVDYASYLANKWGILGRLLGKKDLDREDCEKTLDGSYSVDNKKEIDYDRYWQFLTESNYFDKKVHLQDRFNKVLKATNHEKMTDLSEDEYEKYNADIVSIRELIVKEIKSILKDYEPYMAETPDSFNSTCSGSAWWPIGSDEVTEENGIVFAKGNPAFTGVNSPFGDRIHPITGENKKHTGVDLQGTGNSTNVIAAKDGVIVYPTESDPTNCPSSSSLDSCGGGYGNYVVIQHNDGSYTLYGHMYAGTITVKAGDSVKQGQVIGKVGSSGNSTGAHLHFEVRQGANSSSSSVDPMTIVSADNPRGGGNCNSGSGEIVIPPEYGNAGYFTYTKLTGISWAYDQKKVYQKWIESGAQEDRGVATIDGRYLIACTSTFGKVGDKIDFFLGDGTRLETIMMDEKSQEYTSYDHNPANKWGHENGQQILEFEITRSPNSSGDVGSWMGWTGQRVASATNLGENILN